MPQINAYRRYWDISPPTHLLAAGFMGYKAKREEQSGSLEQLAVAMGAGLPNVR